MLKRWTIAVRGLESGRLTPLLFWRFWTHEAAWETAKRLNEQSTPVIGSLTRYEPYRRRR